MEEILVTGCIVTYNNLQTIEETVTSVLAQTTGIAFQLYIVDNQSTDGTAQLIRERFPQVQLLERAQNEGFGAGHNVLLPLLDSDYHVIINPDVLLQENAIGKMAAFLRENADIGMVSPQILDIQSGKEQILGKRDPTLPFLLASRLRNRQKPPGRLMRRYAMRDKPPDELYDIENASGCFFVIRTALFRKIGGFDERFFLYFEDSDLSRRVRAEQRLVYYPQATVYHKWNRGSARELPLMWIHLKSMLYYFNKWRKD